MADKTKDKSKSKDAKKDAKGKKAKGGEGSVNVAGHPRAVAAIRRAKGFGGIAGFALAGLLAHGAGLTLSHTLERALLAGIAGYLLAWACALTVWRQIITTQARTIAARRASARPARRTLSVASTPDAADPPAPPPTPAAAGPSPSGQ